MILPKSNISIMMVRNAIGYPSTDLGSLCSAGENYINKWSKYKPVHNNFTFNRPADWWRGSMRNCGIDFLQHNTVAKLIASIDSGTSQHPYDPPTGGSTSPYRLGDFAGYNSEAPPPIVGSNVEGTYYKNHPNIGVSAVVRNPGSDELLVTDVFGNQLENMYYAVALQRTDGTVMWMTASNTIETNDSLIEVPTNNLVGGSTYYLYQFLSSYRKPSFTSGTEVGIYVAIPADQRQVIKVESSDVFVDLTNLKRSTMGIVSGNIRIENDGATRTFRNVAVHFRYGNSNIDDAFKVGESLKNLSDITVATNETKVIAFESNVNALPDINQLGGKVLLYMDNKLQTQSYIFQET